jgi:outer membrane protein TolC
MTGHFLKLALVCALAWPAPAHAERYTLRALVAKVSKESPSVVAARAAVAMRRAQLLEQQMRWLPEGDARFFATSAPNVSCQDPMGKGSAAARLDDCFTTNVVDLTRSAPGTSWVDRAPFHGPLLNFGIALRQPIFTSLKIESAIGSAKGGIGVDEANLQTAELDVALNAVRVFTQVKTGRGVVATLETALSMALGWGDRVEREMDGANRARYTESDRIRLRMNATNMRTQVLDQQRNLNAAVEALRAITGDPQADVDESELEWDDPPVEPPAVWRERMMEARPEMRYARAGMRYYTAWRRLQLGWALPDVALISSLGWGYSPTFDLPNLGFANLPASALGGGLGFGLRQPLDLGPKLMHFHQIDRERAMQQSRFKLGIAWWTLEVDKAWLDLDEARRRLAQNQRGERLTQGWYASVDENLALGLTVDGRELVEVILIWSGFRVRRLQSVADSVVALAQLRRMSGQPVLDDAGGSR